MTLRVVLDTNVAVSALLFRNERLSWLRRAWRCGDLVPLVCNRSVSELLRVLTYPKFGLDESEIRDLLGDFLPYTEAVSGNPEIATAPRCRDQNDQVFIDLAFATRVDALVTGDCDLLSLAETSAIQIVSAAELHRRFVADTATGTEISFNRMDSAG